MAQGWEMGFIQHRSQPGVLAQPAVPGGLPWTTDAWKGFPGRSRSNSWGCPEPTALLGARWGWRQSPQGEHRCSCSSLWCG